MLFYNNYFFIILIIFFIFKLKFYLNKNKNNLYIK